MWREWRRAKATQDGAAIVAFALLASDEDKEAMAREPYATSRDFPRWGNKY
jgi:hypothetical protein